MKTLTEDDAPDVWPECEECHEAYDFGRALTFDRGFIWCWHRSCKHKKAGAVLMTNEGPHVNPE